MPGFTSSLKVITCFVVLKSNDKLGPFLQPLQEVDDQVSDIFGVRTLESELFRSHGGQGKRLSKGFVAPAKDIERSRVRINQNQNNTHTHAGL